MPFQTRRRGKSTRTQQRVNAAMGTTRPVGRPPVALDSDFDAVYVKVTLRQITKQQAADELECSVRTLERKFKAIRQARVNALSNSKRRPAESAE